jgi:hypothetical protein
MWSLARSLAHEPLPQPDSGTRLETHFVTPVQLPAEVAVKQWNADGEVRRALCDAKKGRVYMYSHWSELGSES